MGGDLGTAIKGFKKSVKEEPADSSVIESVSTEASKDGEADATGTTEEVTKPQDNT